MILLCLLFLVATALLVVAPPPSRTLASRLGGEASRPHRGRRRCLRVVGAVVLTSSVVTVGAFVAAGRGAVLTFAGVIVAAAATWLFRQRARTRSAGRAEVEVARACEVLSSHLLVGQVPTEALAVAADDCPVLRDARQVHDVGGDVTAVWKEQARRPGHSGLLELARAWQVSSQTGAPLSATLEQVAAALSAEEALRTVVAGELASPRATSKLMAALPACGLGLGYLLGGDPIQWLLAGPIGWTCIVVGVLLACLGVMWIELLARQASTQG